MVVPPSRSPRPSRPVISETVSLRDLPATVVDLLDLEAGAPFPGASLARLWDSAPSAATVDPPVSPTSPALSEVVPTNPLDPDPAKMLEDRRAWASLAEGDLIYIRIRQGDVDREELFDLREDRPPVAQPRRGSGPPVRPRADAGEARQMTAGPLTPQRFRI